MRTLCFLLSATALLTGVGSAQEKKLAQVVVTGFNGTRGIGSVCDAVPGNLIANCGFETGDFTYWMQSGDLSETGVGAPAVPYSGMWAAYFGPVGGLGFISQVIPTIPGQSYDGSTWLRNVGQPNEFQAYWDGILIADFIDLPDFDYMMLSAPGLIASTENTEIRLGFYNVADHFYLDDVVVVPSPM